MGVRSRSMTSSYDEIVVGGGHNGRVEHEYGLVGER
jgi:hypothetical protein